MSHFDDGAPKALSPLHTLLLEPSAHFTGELLVGLLCDLGVKPSTFEWELGKVDLGAADAVQGF